MPLVKPSTYLRQVDPESDPESHEQAIELAKELMGDHFSDSIDYEVDGIKGSAKFPTWAQKDLGDDETLNMGASDFKTFGPSYNKNAVTQGFVDPNSRKGKEIISTYLRREDVLIKFGEQKGTFSGVKEFVTGIVACLKGGKGCGGAPGFVIEVLENSVRDVHELLYSQALNSLLQMLPDPRKIKKTEDGEEQDSTRMSWAAGKTSNVAQNLTGFELPGGGTYTRRKGVQNRMLSGGQGSEGETPDFDDKGYGAETKRGRGLPTGSGLNKESRRQRIIGMFSNLNLNPAQVQDIVQAATHAKADSSRAISSVASDLENPLETLKKRVRASKLKRDEFDGYLVSLLLKFGKSQDEADSIVVNLKDDTMEDVLKVMQSISSAPTSVDSPSARPMPLPAAKAKGGSQGGLLGRIKSIKQTQLPQTSLPPSAPLTDADKDPKVDWVRFKGLPIKERIEYLRHKLRD